MSKMELGLHHDPDLEPKRAKTLFISVCFHIGLFAFLLLNPDLFVQMPKRFIRIGGQDYDLSKNQVTELMMPPQQQRPRPAQPERPMVQPPQPEPQKQAALTPPPPPPPPQPPPPPPKESPVITPDMTLSENARLDGTPKASAGNTEELRAGGGSPDVPKPSPPKTESSGRAETPVPNTNPNGLTLKDLADRVMKQSAQESSPRFPGIGNRQGPRTGIQNPNVQENPDFSTEEPKILSPTYGYNFDPYLNQVINRIRYNWYSLIPEIARFKRGKVVIVFTIDKSGVVLNPKIWANSGTDPLDRAAFGSITASNPFPRIPADFVGDHLDLQITFLYNLNP